MSDQTKQAFPAYTGGGMSLREYYAGQAMKGLLAGGSFKNAEKIAEQAVEFADVLVKQLAK